MCPSFLPWIPPLIDSYEPSALPRLLLPRDELSDSTPECARVMFKSSSAPSSSARESIVRRAGPGQGRLLYTEATPLASFKPELPSSEEATRQSLEQPHGSVGLVGPNCIFESLPPSICVFSPIFGQNFMLMKLKITLPLCYCQRTLLSLQGGAGTQSTGGQFPVPSKAFP